MGKRFHCSMVFEKKKTTSNILVRAKYGRIISLYWSWMTSAVREVDNLRVTSQFCCRTVGTAIFGSDLPATLKWSQAELPYYVCYR